MGRTHSTPPADPAFNRAPGSAGASAGASSGPSPPPAPALPYATRAPKMAVPIRTWVAP